MISVLIALYFLTIQSIQTILLMVRSLLKVELESIKM